MVWVMPRPTVSGFGLARIGVMPCHRAPALRPLSVDILIVGIAVGPPLRIDVQVVRGFPEGLQFESLLVFVYGIPLTRPLGHRGPATTFQRLGRGFVLILPPDISAYELLISFSAFVERPKC